MLLQQDPSVIAQLFGRPSQFSDQPLLLPAPNTLPRGLLGALSVWALHTGGRSWTDARLMVLVPRNQLFFIINYLNLLVVTLVNEIRLSFSCTF